MSRSVIHTDDAPKAIGTYSQAIRTGKLVFLSGQIPLDPVTMKLDNGSVDVEIHRVFRNLDAVARASGGTLADVVKLNVYLTELSNFQQVNEIMAKYFSQPYPARAAVGVRELPRGARVEIDAVMVLGS